MLCHLIAASSAFYWSVRNQYLFDLRPGECRAYWSKSINLALCYRGFSPNQSWAAAVAAGKAAFFCCAYDVITDWRNYNSDYWQKFDVLLGNNLPEDTAQLARGLYQVEKTGHLQQDGLSRGPVALEFVAKVIRTETYLRDRTNFDQLGIVMQIVDDVLDWDDDQRTGEMNCLRSANRSEYLTILGRFSVASMQRVLPHALVLSRIVVIAQRKAEKLRADSGQHISKPFMGRMNIPDDETAKKSPDEVVTEGVADL